jgi:hypothetical protein
VPWQVPWHSWWPNTKIHVLLDSLDLFRLE